LQVSLQRRDSNRCEQSGQNREASSRIAGAVPHDAVDCSAGTAGRAARPRVLPRGSLPDSPWRADAPTRCTRVSMAEPFIAQPRRRRVAETAVFVVTRPPV